MNKLESSDFSPAVTINGDVIEESRSEKLLGVVINNTLTWKDHLYGDEENDGLIPILSKRIGVLRRLRKLVPAYRFKHISFGLFMSKLCYCINLWGGLWDVPGSYDEQAGNRRTCTDYRYYKTKSREFKQQTTLEHQPVHYCRRLINLAITRWWLTILQSKSII